MSIASIAASAAASLLGNIFGQSKTSGAGQNQAAITQQPNTIHHHHHRSDTPAIEQNGTTVAGNGTSGRLDTIV